MKTAMKKLFSLVLVAVLLVGVMPFQAFAASTWYQVVFTDGDRDNINAYLTPGSTFRPSDYIPEGYTFISCTHNFGTGGGVSMDQYQRDEIGDGDSFVMEVRKAAPLICNNCGETGHATCDKVHCTKCGWGNHTFDAHCAFEGCGELNCPGNHCTYDGCGELGCSADKHCNDCGKVVCVCDATVEIIINNAGTGKSFKVAAGKNVNEVYAAYTASSHYDGATGPVLTRPNSNTPVASTEAGKTYWLWLSLNNSTNNSTSCTICGNETHEGDCCATCKQLGHLAENCPNNMCPFCFLDKGECSLCSVCGKCVKENVHQNCTTNTQDQVTLTLDYNYRGAKDGSWKAEKGSLLKDVVSVIPAPTRDGHQFKYWTTDEAGKEIIDENCKSKLTKNGVRIFAQWSDNLAVGGWYTIRVDLNYGHKMGDPVTNIVRGTRMKAVLDNIPTPTRWKHKFVGWYWDEDYKYPVDGSDRVTKNDVIFAKWEERKTNNEVMLKIYLNGNTRTVDKVVDMYDYSTDGEISLSEVQKVVNKYYTSRNSKGMDIDGLYGTESWSRYVNNYNHLHGYDEIKVARDGDTVVYVMVDNAKDRPASSSSSSSSGTADSSNPKTGDMIFTAVTVLVSSASCLAVLYFLNKKRAV